MRMQDMDRDDDLDAQRRALAERIARYAGTAQKLETAIPGLMLVRYDAPTEPVSGMYEPCVCLVAQGAKRVVLGDEEYVYDANHYLITSVGLPVVANVISASSETPLLGVAMKIDLGVTAQLMVDSDRPDARPATPARGMTVSRVTAPLLNAFLRLLDLLQQPEDIPVLAPLVQKEILYRLLQGEQGPQLRRIVRTGSHGFQIAQAIDWLQKHYGQPLRIGNLARRIGMSTSTFHMHFRAMTAMSPLQYQKWMRLHEARRLMVMEQMDATSAAFQVGYESPSQFSREYRRQFGAPPLRDVKNLHKRHTAAGPLADAPPAGDS